MFRLFNVMEYTVSETLDEVLRSREDVCKCPRCRLDIMAIALNRLPPSYVVTSKGEVIARTNALRQQFKVDVIRAITEAIEIVSKTPHHSRKDS